MNRWQALVEVVRLLVESGRPNLAFAAVCIFTLSSVFLISGLIYFSQSATGSVSDLLPELTRLVGSNE